LGYRAKLFAGAEGTRNPKTSFEDYYGEQFFFHGDYIDSKPTGAPLHKFLAHLNKLIHWETDVIYDPVVIEIPEDEEMLGEHAFGQVTGQDVIDITNNSTIEE